MTASSRMLLAYKTQPELDSLWRRMRQSHKGTGANLSLEVLLKQAEEDASRGYVLGRSDFYLGMISLALAIFD